LEAHPIDAWQDESNLRDKIAVVRAKNEDERCATAATCVTRLSLQIPPLIDDLDNSTEAAYTGWPDRLYVIDREGCIAYKSQPGPYGFKPAEVAQTLARLLPGP
jgi:type I thyroxine 5'-deiodinase